MKAVVFTPTYRPGGLDVLEASLMRQSFRNFVWVVCDERYHDRKKAWADILSRVDFPIMFLNVPKKKKNKRNLAAAYNEAVKFAVGDAFDAFISLQDYIWAPEDGFQKFLWACQDNPNDLITGVTHISRDPFPNKIADLDGDYTIFKEEYYGKPKHLSWEDVRVSEIYRGFDPGAIIQVQEGHWEANWAAVPINLLERGARWDTAYDKGIAYENMDFARRCQKEFGSRTLLDTGNVAISLPHKDYFEGEREEIEEHSNRNFYEGKWDGN